MNFNEQIGDLFDLDYKYDLGHCISLDCKMARGIAVEFNRRYSEMKMYLVQTIIHIGKGNPTTIPYIYKDRTIFNLITKRYYFNKPTYGSIEVCIKEMADYCKMNNIRYLGLPKIGCGLDKLKWIKVREYIIENFKDQDIDIQIRYLEEDNK